MIKLMDLGLILIKMGLIMKDNGKTINKPDLVQSIGLMEPAMLVNKSMG